MNKRIFAFALLSSLSASAFSDVQSFDLNISEHSVQSHIDITSPWKNISQQASFIYSDDIKHNQNGYGIFYGLYNNYLGDELSARLGGKFMYVDSDFEDGGALALGGELRWYFYSSVSLRLTGHYAPSILAFADMDEYKEVGAHIVYEVFPNTEIYAGIRDTEVKFDHFRGTSDLQQGFNIGFQMNL